MKFPSSTLLLATAAAFVRAHSDADTASVSSSELREKFDEWMAKYNKVYSAKEEREHRFQIWRDTERLIENHNSQEPSPTFSLGHNAYSDLTLDEFHEHFSMDTAYRPNSEVTMPQDEPQQAVDPAASMNFVSEELYERAVARRVQDLPDSVDWVASGDVTNVKDQGPCGSCWAFSSVGAVESAKSISDGELVDLSPQHVMDCDNHQIDNGCYGGNMMTAFHFVKRNEGICTWSDYPYEAVNHDECGNSSCANVAGSNIGGFTVVETKSPSALMSALVRQPATVAIDASSEYFKSYKSGVFSGPCNTRLNHGVLAVGYGTDADAGADYWLVKNSWGTGWGDNGYVKMARSDKEGVDGTCGVLIEPSTPNFPM
mmetsp:Transcript_1731/g.2574  ORF Transcript_1731/g.2574 Transcript_1731/m.2574 type:complete len:372 (-) Transcript_1731:82-1197(-)